MSILGRMHACRGRGGGRGGGLEDYYTSARRWPRAVRVPAAPRPLANARHRPTPPSLLLTPLSVGPPAALAECRLVFAPPAPQVGFWPERLWCAQFWAPRPCGKGTRRGECVSPIDIVTLNKSKGDGSSGNVGIPSVSILVVISMLSSCVFVTG